MARPKGIWTPEIVRDRIRTTKLVQRLQNHALGKVDMSPTQIKAVEILLKKRLPDLSAIEHSGMVRQQHSREMTEAELERIAAGGSAGATTATQGAPESTPVH